jgi:exopolysaccharide biosynthesis WecB/TagA/CpsF family protein
METPAYPSVDCLGVHVALLTWEQFARWFDEQRARPWGPPARLYIVNAHTLNLAWGQPAFRELLNQGSLVLNDGVGLEMATALAGVRFPYNFNGTDLFPRIFSDLASPERTLRLFLYGARPGRADAVAQLLHQRYPGVQVVGTVDGYQQDDSAIVARINEAAADLLLVAKGNPLQEEWIHTHAPQLQVRVVAGVGALLDFLSGSVPRAPVWMRRAKMEWVYRLAVEPRRMFRRYVLGNPLFLARALYYQSRRPR